MIAMLVNYSGVKMSSQGDYLVRDGWRAGNEINGIKNVFQVPQDTLASLTAVTASAKIKTHPRTFCLFTD